MAIKPNDDFEKYGDLKTFEPDLRQEHSDVIADYFQSMGIASTPQTARDMAEGIMGSTNPSYGIADMMGVVDFTPAGLIYAADEVKTGYEEAKTGTDYIIPTVVGALSVLEAYPLTKALAMPVKRFIQNLAKKSAQLPTDVGRRDAVKKIAGAAAGASVPGLGALKLLDAPTSPGPKIVEDIAPVVKKITAELPKNFFDLSSFKIAEKNINFQVGSENYSSFISDLDPEDLLDSGLPNDIAKATDEQIEKVGEMINQDGGLDSAEMFLNDVDDVQAYLDGEIDLDDVNTTGVAYDMLKQLQDEYNLSKSEIKQYFEESDLRLDTWRQLLLDDVKHALPADDLLPRAEINVWDQTKWRQ
jgi:hypothetical protein